ncbi:Serine-glyoxylate transaminase [Thermoproteus uzoniensis 768-20]|uniref:Serine-glyoxylate transaminase n=1 Tax=Thermoproteus uzoniensis (strain 768-20) TaxID=999630 RepID=F2L0E5_THEU7|nr:Serine-glyoxylate transaminase [Thermoproteus uzoniensis 768-20]
MRAALIRETTNPDLDPGFLDLYNSVRARLKRLVGAEKGDLYIWVGEAMLGLDAAVANTVREGTKVLVIDNGVFGEGFADLVKLYGGRPVTLGLDWRRSADLHAVERALELHKDVEVVTLVHCDTPSALLNDLRELGKVVRSFGPLLVVDSVSAVGATEIKFDDWGIDVLIGGSQKALNVPTGLTIFAASERAWERFKAVGRGSFYLNPMLWKEMLDGRGVFPYTFSDVLLYALDEGLKMIFEEGLDSVYARHEAARRAARAALEAMGLQPYTADVSCTCPTVTAFAPPPGIRPADVRKIAWEKYGVMIAGSWGKLEDSVLRIGHMGVQASYAHLALAFSALGRALADLGYKADVGAALEAIAERF